MQEAFLQLFRKIGTFRGESAFSTWLHRMTVNVVLMRLRKKALPVASLEETTEPDEETGGPRKDVGAPDLRLSGAVDRVNLERSIDKLPPGYRTVFVLHDVQGYEHNEIAGIMGCSVGNSKSQLHKARTKLRDSLQEEVREQARQERHSAKTQTSHGDWLEYFGKFWGAVPGRTGQQYRGISRERFPERYVLRSERPCSVKKWKSSSNKRAGHPCPKRRVPTSPVVATVRA